MDSQLYPTAVEPFVRTQFRWLMNPAHIDHIRQLHPTRTSWQITPGWHNAPPSSDSRVHTAGLSKLSRADLCQLSPHVIFCSSHTDHRTALHGTTSESYRLDSACSGPRSLQTEVNSWYCGLITKPGIPHTRWKEGEWRLNKNVMENSWI
jgi:hypothetical protein